MSDVGEEDSYDVCSICGRENESYGAEDDEFGGANYFTISDHRELWKLDGSRSWHVSGATKIDVFARRIEEDYPRENFELSTMQYKKIFEECKRLLSESDFNLETALKLRAAERFSRS